MILFIFYFILNKNFTCTVCTDFQTKSYGIQKFIGGKLFQNHRSNVFYSIWNIFVVLQLQMNTVGYDWRSWMVRPVVHISTPTIYGYVLDLFFSSVIQSTFDCNIIIIWTTTKLTVCSFVSPDELKIEQTLRKEMLYGRNI